MMPLTMMHGKPRCSPGYEWMQLAIYGNQGVGRVGWKVGVRGQGRFPWRRVMRLQYLCSLCSVRYI